MRNRPCLCCDPLQNDQFNIAENDLYGSKSADVSDTDEYEYSFPEEGSALSTVCDEQASMGGDPGEGEGPSRYK